MSTPKPLKIFVDSDVIISSLISTAGAAFKLIHETKDIKLHASNYSILELEKVVARLNLELGELHEVIEERFVTIDIGMPYEKVQLIYEEYTKDTHDTHIVAGAKESKASFLITYNLRHFESEKLSKDYQIKVLTPGLFLQYLRSL